MHLFISFISLLISSTLAFSANWSLHYFGLSCFEQIVFHLKIPLEGTNTEFIKDWLRLCLVRALALSILLCAILFMINPILIVSASLLISVICLLYAIWRVGIFAYLIHLFQTTKLYEEYYVDPKKVKMTFPEQKRNLIYIYVESLETAYASKHDGGAYPEDLISEITTLAKTNINFSHGDRLGGAHVVTGTGWTTGGIVAQSAGIPLTVPFTIPRYNEQTPFFPGAYGIGDVLKNEGYRQEYLIGSDALFGGRKFFFNKHGEYSIFDLNTAYQTGKIDNDYKVFWGYEDEKLFTFAKEELTTLAQSNQPFNFTMLTVDTHHPYGYKDKHYQDKYPERLSNIIMENSKKIGAFVAWIQKQPFYDNTTIVISGDHTSMAAEYIHKTYPKDYVRTTFNTIINSTIQTEHSKNRCFTNFDMYPTTLASMGVTIEGNQLGLGTNLFTKKKTLAEKIGIPTLDKELKKQSKYYKKYILNHESEVKGGIK